MEKIEIARIVARYLLVLVYLSAGVAHLIATERFLPIVPDWVPFPRQTIILTGLCEIAGSIGLLTEGRRRIAGIMLAIYAICVYPANIKHAIEAVQVSPIPHSWWYHGPRLAFQPVFVWWALFCSGVVDWPFQSK